ncbi:MAG: S-methyl-5'-thioadenosine phosphorylase [Phycisphaerales bacterium]|nr:S-methyl-5'-thioadenosine phosphorylase [Phycisphaerales bacterium]
MRIGIIGGTGLGESLTGAVDTADFTPTQPDTPFGRPSSPILLGRVGDVDVALLQRHGEGHILNPRTVPYRANIFALKQLGVTHILASAATGSLREEIEPGDLVICDQLIDRTEGRPRTFYECAAVHVEFAEPFCPVMRRWVKDAAAHVDRTIHRAGTYICMEGPSFSTVAESKMHQAWGGDLIGMTTCPEARLAREAEIAYALIAIVTDYDCWRPRESHQNGFELLEEIIANMKHATQASIELIEVALRDVTLLRDEPSPAHDALKLAIWSDKSRINPADIARLAPLWGRHFQ